MAETSGSFQHMLWRRKLAVALILVMVFLFLLLLNIASYTFLRRTGRQLEASLDARLLTAARLGATIVENDLISLYARTDLALVQLDLTQIRSNNELEAAYLIDPALNVLIDTQAPPPSRGYIRADSLAIARALDTGVATSELHRVAGNPFKNAYASISDLDGNTAFLVLEANADFFNIISSYRQRLYINSMVSAGVFVVFTVFLVVAALRFLRTEAKLQQAQRLAAMGQMTATMAHEIRNPLGIIKSSTDVLREKYQDPDQPDELFEFVDDEIKRLGRLVNDFLTFSREPLLNTKYMDINTTLADAVKHFQSEYAVEVKFEPEAPIRTQYDPDKLYQVILNILLNARQAMGDEPGTITIRSRVSKLRGKSVAEISIRDNGTGFKDATRIFEPFYTTKTQGTGLGLAVCRAIIEKHGGSIAAASPESGGAELTIHLPLITK